MNLREDIRKILKEETKLPSSVKRRLHYADEYINNLDPDDVCEYWTVDEVNEYTSGTLSDIIRVMIGDSSGINSDNYGSVYDVIYEFLVNLNYPEQIRDFFLDSMDNCGIINESTFFRRRVDMRLMEKEFFDILNIITDVYLGKYNHGIDFNFETFENHTIDYFMDGYYNDLTNGGENDYPFDEVYEFLSNHFHNKIKDRYDTYFGRNINESKTLQENEEDPTQKILNFLLRRYEIEEHIFGDEDRPIIIKMLRIKNSYGQSYSIRSTGSKKEQIRDILDTLMILNVIDDFDFSKTKDNPYAQKVVRAVKMFYDKVMGNKSNMNESKILDKIKSFLGKKPLGKKPLSKDDKIINAIVGFIKDNYNIKEFMDTRDNQGDYLYTLIDEHQWVFNYFTSDKRLHYSWKFAEDIHNWIGIDGRLLQPDSEMMGKIFEKLFNKKVNKVFGYSRL